MPRARFENCVSVTGSWSDCHKYLVSCFARVEFPQTLCFWKVEDDDGNALVAEQDQFTFNALAEDAKALQHLFAFASH